MADNGIKYGSVPKTEPGLFEAYPPDSPEERMAAARRGFISKVYGILTMQLAFTVGCCYFFMYYDPLREFIVERGLILYWVGAIGAFVSVIAAYFLKNRFPWNILCLVGITIFSKIDFSFLSLWLFAGLIIMFGWSLLNLIFGWHASFLYGACGALLFSGFICYDTFVILNRLSVDDWLPACIELYLDIINLFLYILEMVGARN